MANKSEKLNSSEIQNFLKSWFDNLGASEIQLIENLNPVKDPNSSYDVSYEAKFESTVLDKARLEIWVTEKGEIGFGFETYRRLGQRINKLNNNSRFIMGIEPHFLSRNCLKKILELISSGRVAVTYRALPFIGIISAKAVIEDQDLNELKQNGLSEVNNLSSGDITRQDSIKFKPW